MAFQDREYLVYVVLGRPTASPPWVERTWMHIFGALDPLVHTARDAAALRSTQLGSPNRRKISFGRIGWNKPGCKKWTHSDDGRLVSGDEAEFLTCEVWAPSWTVCERQGLGPDVYFAVRRESGKPDELKFNSVCIMALASDSGQTDEARKGADCIASVL